MHGQGLLVVGLHRGCTVAGLRRGLRRGEAGGWAKQGAAQSGGASTTGLCGYVGRRSCCTGQRRGWPAGLRDNFAGAERGWPERGWPGRGCARAGLHKG
ncbi:hypothetical protein Acr_00g0033920 [Actinidia rufa]|uniref:Uncharacterized protein n=1 Tax=Actinidia rufa TaxID=165716 RepID=A0A7J0DGY8_9ERIC|nr:hypothetical protein Acr_00g0033920 [Actinidia rufa]